ncbi:MAG: hypothetical protein SF123_22340 [Chloroflexota bacterium]|nr:hypothetical protein [Chloroflexota bacterium]
MSSLPVSRSMWQRWLPILVTTLGGGITGTLLMLNLLDPVNNQGQPLYIVFALGGAVYGLSAGWAVHLQLPGFSTGYIVRYMIIVSVGFIVGIFLAYELWRLWMFPVPVSGFVFPPAIGFIAGRIAQRWINDVAGFPRQAAKPGWGLGAAVYVPTLFLLGSLIGLTLLRVDENFVLIVGSIAGACGGYISGAITRNSIRSGLERQQAIRQMQPPTVVQVAAIDTDASSAELGTLAQQQASQSASLQVIAEDGEAVFKGKPKAKALNLPLPRTAQQWRMAGVVAVIVFLGTGAFFSFFPTRTIVLVATPTGFPNPTLFPLPTPTDAPFPARFAIGQPVQVFNLDDTLRYEPYWWVLRQQWLPGTQEWIYEVQAGSGVTLMRAENQLAPIIPTQAATQFATPVGMYDHQVWDWSLPLQAAAAIGDIPSGHYPIYITDTQWNATLGRWMYLVQDAEGRMGEAFDEQIGIPGAFFSTLVPTPDGATPPPIPMPTEPDYWVGEMGLMLTQVVAFYDVGTRVRVENRYWSNGGGWQYLVVSSDGGRMWVRETALSREIASNVPTPTFLPSPSP